MGNPLKRAARAKAKRKQLNIISNNVAPDKKRQSLVAMDNARHNKAAPAMRPKPGYMWNPLLGYPPNIHCWCGKLKKAKMCCLPRVNKAVPIGVGEKLKEYMKAVEENQQRPFKIESGDKSEIKNYPPPPKPVGEMVIFDESTEMTPEQVDALADRMKNASVP